MQRLRKFGVEERKGFGKVSEVVLIKPDKPGSNKGPQFTIKHHGEGTEIYVPVINALLRRFGISKKEFWEK